MTMVLVCTIGNAQAFNFIWIDSFNPEKVLSTESVKAVVDVQILMHSESHVVNVKNTSPINELRVYNSDGKLVSKKSQLSNSFEYDMSKLNAGVYCFRIQIDKEIVTKMVVKT